MQAYIANLSEDFSLPLIKDRKYFVYFSGCNFKCRYCNSCSLLEFKNENTLLLKDLKKEIEIRKNEINAIVFTGGEPCLQRQALLEMCRFTRRLKKKIIVDTNGSKPESIKSILMSELVDEIWLDIKAPFNSILFEKVTKSSTFFKPTYEIMIDIKDTLKLLKESKVNIRVKTLVIPSLMFKKEDLLEIASALNGLNCVWEITPFNTEDNMVDKNLNNICPPTDKFMLTIKEAIIKEYPNLIIEIPINK